MRLKVKKNNNNINDATKDNCSTVTTTSNENNNNNLNNNISFTLPIELTEYEVKLINEIQNAFQIFEYFNQNNKSSDIHNQIERLMRMKIVMMRMMDNDHNYNYQHYYTSIVNNNDNINETRKNLRKCNMMRTVQPVDHHQNEDDHLHDSSLEFNSISFTLQHYLYQIVQYCYGISTFRLLLNHEDQLLILEQFYLELLSIWFAYYYNSERDTISLIMIDDKYKHQQQKQQASSFNQIEIKLESLKTIFNISNNSSASAVLGVARNLIQELNNEIDNDPIVRNLVS